MMRFAAAVVLSLLAGGEGKVTWMKLDAAQQVAGATGMPILVYSGFT